MYIYIYMYRPQPLDKKIKIDLDLLKTLILSSAFHLFLKKKLHVCRFHFV